MKIEDHLSHLWIPLPTRPGFISPPSKQLEIYDCVLRLRSGLHTQAEGLPQQQQKSKSPGICSSPFPPSREADGWPSPLSVTWWKLRGFRTTWSLDRNKNPRNRRLLDGSYRLRKNLQSSNYSLH